MLTVLSARSGTALVGSRFWLRLLTLCHVRPRRTDGIEDKYRFVRYVERLEGIWITGVPPQDIALMKAKEHSPESRQM